MPSVPAHMDGTFTFPLEGEQQTNFLRAHASFARLGPREGVWIPFGFQFALFANAQKTTYLHQPYLALGLAREVAPELFERVRHLNLTYLDLNKEDRTLREFGPAIRDWFATVAHTPAAAVDAPPGGDAPAAAPATAPAAPTPAAAEPGPAEGESAS